MLGINVFVRELKLKKGPFLHEGKARVAGAEFGVHRECEEAEGVLAEQLFAELCAVLFDVQVWAGDYECDV